MDIDPSWGDTCRVGCCCGIGIVLALLSSLFFLPSSFSLLESLPAGDMGYDENLDSDDDSDDELDRLVARVGKVKVEGKNEEN